MLFNSLKRRIDKLAKRHDLSISNGAIHIVSRWIAKEKIAKKVEIMPFNDYDWVNCKRVLGTSFFVVVEGYNSGTISFSGEVKLPSILKPPMQEEREARWSDEKATPSSKGWEHAIITHRGWSLPSNGVICAAALGESTTPFCNYEAPLWQLKIKAPLLAFVDDCYSIRDGKERFPTRKVPMVKTHTELLQRTGEWKCEENTWNELFVRSECILGARLIHIQWKDGQKKVIPLTKWISKGKAFLKAII